MINHDTAISGCRRGLIASGAIMAALSVALAAYASHGAEGSQARLQTAAAFALGHGIALAALAPRCVRRLDTIALTALLAGTLLFAGSLVGAYAFGWPTVLAPLGGSTMIAAWLLYAADALRR